MHRAWSPWVPTTQPSERLAARLCIDPENYPAPIADRMSDTLRSKYKTQRQQIRTYAFSLYNKLSCNFIVYIILALGHISRLDKRKNI